MTDIFQILKNNLSTTASHPFHDLVLSGVAMDAPGLMQNSLEILIADQILVSLTVDCLSISRLRERGAEIVMF